MGGRGVCQCPLGFVGEYCEEPVEVKVRVTYLKKDLKDTFLSALILHPIVTTMHEKI